MNKEFIPYEQALELKELGFEDDCLAIHSINLMTENEDWWSMEKSRISR